MSFCVEYWHVLVYNLDDKLKAPWQIRYSGKDLHIFPGWYSIPLWYLLDSWENDAFFYPQQTAMYCCPVPWGALSNNWVSCKVYQFWIYLLHENTWKRTFIISGEIIWKRKIVSLENNLFVQDMWTNLHNMDTWQKKNIFFTEQLPVAASGYCVYFLLQLMRVDVRLNKKKMKF